MTDTTTDPSKPPLPEVSDEVKAAFDLLDLDHETATLEDVEDAYDGKVPEFHPAIDGSEEEFTKLKFARQTARVYVL